MDKPLVKIRMWKILAKGKALFLRGCMGERGGRRR